MAIVGKKNHPPGKFQTGDVCFIARAKKLHAPSRKIRLLTETELADDGTVTLDVAVLEVVKHATTAADHLLERVVGSMVLLVELHVLSEVVDTEREQCYLAFC